MNVPNESLDAVAKVLFMSSLPDDTGSAQVAECVRLAAMCLQAGGPAIAAQAWDEGARAMFVDDPLSPTPTNPYRSET